jgi:hypothetical protein
MQIEMLEYVEINLIGIILLLTILLSFRKMRSLEQREEQTYFVKMLVLNALILFADNSIYFLRGHGAPGLVFLNHIFCIAYFIHACMVLLFVGAVRDPAAGSAAPRHDPGEDPPVCAGGDQHRMHAAHAFYRMGLYDQCRQPLSPGISWCGFPF